MVVAQKKDSPCLRFLKKVRFEGGERETDLWVHALFEITLVFLSFPFSFLFSFLSFSFLFCSVFSFHSKNMLCFLIPQQGTGRALFIASAVASVLLFRPSTTFIWSGCTCRPPGLCNIHPRQTEAGLFCSFVFLPRY